jgi:protein SCO1/2
MNRHAMTKPIQIFAPLVLLLGISGCGGIAQEERGDLAGADIGGPFTLSDKTGKTVRWEQFDGKYRIVYFGYAFCPDVCPLDMAKTMQGLARFEKDEPQLAAQIQPIFITIDPARDTPQAVGEFAAAFSPRLIGLTGTPAQIDQAVKAFKVYAAKGKDTAGGYLMDHSRMVYLMGKKGEPIALLPSEKGAEAVAAELAKWVK